MEQLVYAVGTVIPSLVLALGFAMALCAIEPGVNALFRARCSSARPGAAGRGGLAVLLHLPARRRAARLLPRQARRRGPNWLGDPDIALWSMIGLTVWKNAGYYMLFYLAGLQTVPARRAMRRRSSTAPTPWQRLRHVILPGCADHGLRAGDRA